MNSFGRTSRINPVVYLQRAILGSIVGIILGGGIGAAILGGMAWFKEMSNGIDEQSQWAFVGILIGAKLGMVSGGVLGIIVGLITAVHRQRK